MLGHAAGMDCAHHLHKSLSFHTWTTTSPFLRNENCPFFKWFASCPRSGGMLLVGPHSDTNFLSMFQQISHNYKNVLLDVMILA